MSATNGGEPRPTPTFAPLVAPMPLPKMTGASVVRLATGAGAVLLQVHNTGGMAFAFLGPDEADALAESLTRNAQAARLAVPPRGLHLPEN